MDNLTHSLVGALIGQAGLKRRTGLAMPALIIGANIPDIDGACMALGTVSLAMRRGLTHGPIAWVVLPLLIAALLYGWDRWQARRGKRPEGRLPVRFGWLYALALIACLTHPALDWLNGYGIRFLEPFSSHWYYGDILFIIDIWLWIGLGAALWVSLRRERRGRNWRGPAGIALGAAIAYIGVNGAISHVAESQARLREPYPAVVIPSIQPIASWRRELITGEDDGIWTVGSRRIGDLPLARCDLAAARQQDRRIDAFLFWSRAPYVWREGGQWMLGDARFAGRSGTFAVTLPPGICPDD